MTIASDFFDNKNVVKINNALIKGMGKLGDFVNNESSQEIFFQPYKGTAYFALRAATVVTAPICASILAVEFLLATLVESLAYLCNRPTGDKKASAENVAAIKEYLPVAAFFIGVAIVAPLVNLVDLIGATVTTLKGSEAGGRADEDQQMNAGLSR